MNKVTGLETILKNLNVEIHKIERRTQAGLVEAAERIKGISQKKVPVVTGNLKNSAFVVWQKPAAIIGYSAVYALSVHENPRAGKVHGSFTFAGSFSPVHYKRGKQHKKTFSTVGEWKFLENPLKENHKLILSIIKRNARIK